MKRFVSNYACPEGSIANQYLSLECVRFSETFLKKNGTLSGCDATRVAAVLEDHPLSAGKSMELDGNVLAIAHHYVLFNLAITEPFLK